ncbi:MAG TPA: hypothetical protein QF720_05670 [Nitrospinota bacterium]|jgi:hypothetical protein|nr:hypothetical protein [Nitrospinota bacterium]|tara:strand:- start:2656 stop:2922 length:267 start_codon:yes stop_codon:yes gene_type:complete
MKILVRHKVKDFDFWKSVYEKHSSSREGIGAKDFKVYCNSKSRNDVFVIADVTDAEKLQSLAGDNDLKTLLRESGVVGIPEVLLLDEA